MEKNVDEIVINNTKLIYVALKKLKMYNQLCIENYYDVGMIGLVKGAKKYNCDLGYSESSFLTKCIINEILCQRRKENNKCRVNLDFVISLSSPVHENINLEDTLKSNVDIQKDLEDKEEVLILEDAISELSSMERFIIVYSYGLFGEDKLTQREIAKRTGQSQANVSRTKLKVIKKLREIMNGKVKRKLY